MAILNRFSAILLYREPTHFLLLRCGISGDSRPAIPGIVRFTMRDSVPLRSGPKVLIRYSGIGVEGHLWVLRPALAAP